MFVFPIFEILTMAMVLMDSTSHRAKFGDRSNRCLYLAICDF